jgi:hypothetical protein
MGNACDVTMCRESARCEIPPEWCKAWGYFHGRDRSNACAAFVRAVIPKELLTMDAGGVLRVDMGAAPHV